MRIFAFALALLAVPTHAAAQTAPTPTVTSELSANTPIEAIVAVPEGKAVLQAKMPNLLTHAMYDSFKGMSLRELQPYSQGAITDERVAEVDAALKAIGKK